MEFRFVFIFLMVEGAYSVSLIRANTVIAKFRPLGMNHLLPDGAGAVHKYSRGFGDALARGGGGSEVGVKIKLF